jgi:hypothetical protein
MSIRRVQKLREQGPRGSLAYQKATSVARAYVRKATTKPVVGISGDGPKGGVSSWLNPALAPPTTPLKYGTPRRIITGVKGANGTS